MSNNNPLLQFFKEVAQKRFSNDIRKASEVIDLGNRINVHCPFCGDSSKANGKPRGWIRKDSRRYSCYNDGCNAKYLSLEDCISKLSQKFSVSIENISADDLKPSEIDHVKVANRKKFKQSTKSSSSHNPFREFLTDVGILEILPTISQFKLLMNLRSLNEIELYHTLINCNDNKDRETYANNDEFGILNYLITERNVHKSKIAEKLILINSSFDKIYLMNCDIESGRILSFATRTFPDKNYKVYKLDDLKRIFRYDNEVLEEYLSLFVDVSNMFNVLNVNFNEKCRVVEGQFDSMFVNNGFSINSVNNIWMLSLYFEDKELISYFDCDKAGVKGGLSHIVKKFFMWQKYKSFLIEKDYKSVDWIKYKMKDVNDAFNYYCKGGIEGGVDGFNLEISEFESGDLIDKFYL